MCRKKIYPVFRDKTDLTGGKVLNALHKELEESQFLIVICSPKSASSEWVSREIQHFIELGQEDNIIPFIVEGNRFQKTSTGNVTRKRSKKRCPRSFSASA